MTPPIAATRTVMRFDVNGDIRHAVSHPRKPCSFSTVLPGCRLFDDDRVPASKRMHPRARPTPGLRHCTPATPAPCAFYATVRVEQVVPERERQQDGKLHP